jgi:F-type H+-transporting ATPase subunit a
MHDLQVPLLFWIPFPGLDKEDCTILTNTLLVCGLLLVLSLLATRKMKMKPGALQNALEMLTDWLLEMLRSIIGPEGPRYLPLVASLFLFIFVANLISPVPGLLAPTSSINTIIPLAAIVFLMTPAVGIRILGLKGYLKHKAGPIPFLAPFVFLFESIGELARPVSLTIRLFTNIKAGDILLLTLMLVFVKTPTDPLVPLLSFMAMGFGIFVAFIQAYVFAFLTVVYFASASGWGESNSHA